MWPFASSSLRKATCTSSTPFSLRRSGGSGIELEGAGRGHASFDEDCAGDCAAVVWENGVCAAASPAAAKGSSTNNNSGARAKIMCVFVPAPAVELCANFRQWRWRSRL